MMRLQNFEIEIVAQNYLRLAGQRKKAAFHPDDEILKRTQLESYLHAAKDLQSAALFS